MSQTKQLPKPKALTKLTEYGALKKMFKIAGLVTRLQALFDSKIQPAARPYCRVAYWRAGELLIIVTDGNWATRLRYQQKRLQRDLEMIPEFYGLRRLIFKVQPVAEDKKPAKASRELSDVAVETIKDAVGGITDPKLKDALERLSSRGKKFKTTD